MKKLLSSQIDRDARQQGKRSGWGIFEIGRSGPGRPELGEKLIAGEVECVFSEPDEV